MLEDDRKVPASIEVRDVTPDTPWQDFERSDGQTGVEDELTENERDERGDRNSRS